MNDMHPIDALLTRRDALLASAAALAMGTAAMRPAAAGTLRALELIESLGQPSALWTTFNVLQPVLQDTLGCPVGLQTITGDGNLNAARAMLEPSPDVEKLLGVSVMGMQFAGRAPDYGVKIQDLTPIAKLSDGFSIALFARAGGPVQTWQDAMAAAAVTPLAVSCLETATSAHVAMLMAERLGGLAMAVTARGTIADIIDDVLEGRSVAGFMATKLAGLDRARLTTLVSFGAERNAAMPEVPTFAEVTGEPKNAFTESIAVLGAPDLDRAVADELVAGFLKAGKEPSVMATRDTVLFPVVINGPEVLRATIERNDRVLDAILG